jgi:hypothetical protein
MRTSALKLALAVISGLAVIALGNGRAAAPPPDPCPDVVLHLRTAGGNLSLDTAAPGAGAASFVDARGLSRARGNSYKLIGEWDGYVDTDAGAGCVLEALGPLHVWLGLRNSDDQGTNFDLRAELYFKGSGPGASTDLIATADQLCIKGLTRNSARAQEIVSPLVLFGPIVDEGEVFLKLYGRIGTPQQTCGGHASATGLRLYFNSAERDSRFDMFFFEAACS